jgi:3-hydroxyisobutyrate dehydrogenase-like beta-hydroxyacid dehydrogenase
MAEEHTVGIVGTGALGSALAGAALKHGITTSVWNRTPGRASALVEAGAALRPTVAGLVGATAVVVMTVSTYDDVRSVLTEAGESVRGRTIVNLSSGTPSDAVAIAEYVGSLGGRYLDGAAMSGTRLVGDSSAKFFYSGDRDAFSECRDTLEAFGTALFLGADPATASAYDTAILGMILGFLTSSYQALASLQRQDIDAEHFPTVVRDYWPFVVGLFDQHATQIRTNAITADDGTIDVYVDAIRHVIDTGASLGIDTSLAEAISRLLRRTSDNGHGTDGLPYLAETINAIGASL